jgi:hypothetical protein
MSSHCTWFFHFLARSYELGILQNTIFILTFTFQSNKKSYIVQKKYQLKIKTLTHAKFWMTYIYIGLNFLVRVHIYIYVCVCVCVCVCHSILQDYYTMCS